MYTLAEHQSGNATTIKVKASGNSFRVSDDGRGHALKRTIDGLPYFRFIYSHLDYPFDRNAASPIQLHTIGMSLVNSLCTELTVSVYQDGNVFRKFYRNGRLNREETGENVENATGTTVEGTIDSDRFLTETDLQDLEQWLRTIQSVNHGLSLFFNEKEVKTE